MIEQGNKMHLPKVDDLFTTQKERDESKLEKVLNVSLLEIDDFPNHPFKVAENEELLNLATSIKENGMLVPTLVRMKENGRYEMVSGHRRKKACEIIGLKEIPCIVKKLTDDEATIIMVDSNMYREKILPSERAFAYKMKLEAVRHQGKRNDLTLRPLVEKLNSADIIGQDFGDSGRQVQRYIRLTELIPELLQLVDNEMLGNIPHMALRPAVEISYLDKNEQVMLLDYIECNEVTPSLSQAIQLKTLSRKKRLSFDDIENMLSVEKPNQLPKLKIDINRLKNVLPRTLVSNKEKEEFVIKAVEYYCKKQKEKQSER